MELVDRRSSIHTKQNIVKSKLSDEDQYLITCCHEGQEGAKRALYDKYVGAMYHTVLRMVKNRTDAEDILQEAFIKVFTQLHTFKGQSTLGAWIKRIVINDALTFLRKHKKMNWVSVEEEILQLPDMDEARVVRFSMKAIHNAILGLPAGCRTILNLFLLEGYQHKEIAQILNISESTSKSQYHRGRKLLQQLLESKNDYYE